MDNNWISDELNFIGGMGISTAIFSREIPSDVDPLGENNLLILSVGPFCGTAIPFCGRHFVIAKSPLTNILGEASSGGFFGKGFLNGTQTQLRFLPAQHTDFVFSVIGEEFGFIGVLIILTLFYIILCRGLYIASNTRNRYASLMTIGIVTILTFHVVVTIGMTVGVMPVTGIPLPFLSYGGSSLIANMILIGLIINTSIRRYKY